MLRDVSNVNMKTTIMGDEVDFPIGVAPTALQRMAHDDGELATARGELHKTIMTLSYDCYIRIMIIFMMVKFKSKTSSHSLNANYVHRNAYT